MTYHKEDVTICLWIAACILIGYWLATNFHEFFSGALRMSTKVKAPSPRLILTVRRNADTVKLLVKNNVRYLRFYKSNTKLLTSK